MLVSFRSIWPRLGAAEVVGIDCENTWPRWQEQADFLKSVLEWRCRTKYNVRYLECNMNDLPNLDLGEFDAVIALNCLYYIEEEKIGTLTRHISTITDRFVVQCNTRDQKALGRRPYPAFYAIGPRGKWISQSDLRLALGSTAKTRLAPAI